MPERTSPGSAAASAPATLPEAEVLEPEVAAPVAAEADTQLLDIFRTEAQAHLETVRRFLEHSEAGSAQPVSDNLLRALHTLKGQCPYGGSSPMAELASALERLAKEYKLAHVAFAEPECALLARGAELLEQRLGELDEGALATPLAGAPDVISSCEALLEELDPQLPLPEAPLPEQRDILRLTDFLMPGMDLLLEADERCMPGGPVVTKRPARTCWPSG